MRFTQADYKLFRREVGECLVRLGLTNWSTGFLFSGLGDGVYAQVEYTFNAKTATFTLNSDDMARVDRPGAVVQSARHECCELLLADLAAMCYYSFARDRVEEELHNVIRRLEKVL